MKQRRNPKKKARKTVNNGELLKFSLQREITSRCDSNLKMLYYVYDNILELKKLADSRKIDIAANKLFSIASQIKNLGKF